MERNEIAIQSLNEFNRLMQTHVKEQKLELQRLQQELTLLKDREKALMVVVEAAKMCISRWCDEQRVLIAEEMNLCRALTAVKGIITKGGQNVQDR